MLGVTDRTFRRYVTRYEAEGTGGLADRRKGRSHRRAPEEEMARVRELYGKEHEGWNVRHFTKRTGQSTGEAGRIRGRRTCCRRRGW